MISPSCVFSHCQGGTMPTLQPIFNGNNLRLCIRAAHAVSRLHDRDSRRVSILAIPDAAHHRAVSEQQIPDRQSGRFETREAVLQHHQIPREHRGACHRHRHRHQRCSGIAVKLSQTFDWKKAARASAPAKDRRDILQDRLDDMSVVVDAKLIGHGQKHRPRQ
jgi:hypothetical protein